MPIERRLDGYRWCAATGAGVSVPTRWRRLLSDQTLPEAAADGETVFYLFTLGLTDDEVPERDSTLLERLAWALLARPECAVAVQSVHAAVDFPWAVGLGALARGASKRIEASGLVGLVRHRAQAVLCSALAEGSSVLEGVLGHGMEVVVLPRALGAERLRLALRPAERVREGFQARVKGAIRRNMAPAHVAWLRRLIERIRPLARTERSGEPAAGADDPLLARRKSWEPAFACPEVATRSRAEDHRVAVWMAVHWLELGGAEKFAVDLIRSLPRDRYRIYVTTDVPSENPWADRIRELVEELLVLPDFLTEDMFGIFAAHYVATRGIQMIHIHHAPRIYGSLFHVRRFFPDIKVLHTLHILELPPHPGGYPEHALRYFGVFIDHHHVISHHLERFLIERWRVPPDRIDVIYLNVDTDYFDPQRVVRGRVRAEHHIPADALVVAFVGRLSRQKRPEEFVRMAGILASRWRAAEVGQGLHFLMAGDGPLRGSVEALIRELGIGAVAHLQGELGDVRGIYADCDLVALPSENEGLALVSYEAMAMARPIVCTDVGAQSELVPAELLVAEGEGLAERMAEKVEWLLRDAPQRELLGRRAREHVCVRHRQEATWAALHALYDRLLRDGPVGGGVQ